MQRSPLLGLVERMLSALQRLDHDAIMACMSDDVCGLDEITKTFVRGRAAMDAYVSDLVAKAPAVTSHILDFHEIVTADAAFVTCRLEQRYVLDGVERVHHTPTTYGFRVVDEHWKICVFHSVPLD